MPSELPDRLEAGTLPLCPILSIKNGLKYLEKLGWSAIHSRIQKLNDGLIERIDSLHEIKRISDHDLGICSFTHQSLSAEAIAHKLGCDGICVRSGLHCSPSAHLVYGTIESGTVRISLSILNTVKDLDVLYNALRSL